MTIVTTQKMTKKTLAILAAQQEVKGSRTIELANIDGKGILIKTHGMTDYVTFIADTVDCLNETNHRNSQSWDPKCKLKCGFVLGTNVGFNSSRSSSLMGDFILLNGHCKNKAYEPYDQSNIRGKTQKLQTIRVGLCVAEKCEELCACLTEDTLGRILPTCLNHLKSLQEGAFTRFYSYAEAEDAFVAPANENHAKPKFVYPFGRVIASRKDIDRIRNEK